MLDNVNNNTDLLQVQGIMSQGYGLAPKMVTQDRRLTPEAKGIYSYFCSFAGAGTTAFPSRDKILYDMQIGETRYYKHFKLLKKYGYISVKQNIDNKGKFKNNIYTLVQMVQPYPHFTCTDNRGTNNTSNNINNINNSYNNPILSNQEEKKEEQTDQMRFEEKINEMVENRKKERENKTLSQPTQNAVEAVAMIEVQKELATTSSDSHTFVEPIAKATATTYEPITTTQVATPVIAPATVPTQSVETPVVRYQHAQVESVIKEKIEYNLLLQDNITSQETLNEIVSAVTDTICTQYRDGYIYMGNERVPSELVKSKFFKLSSDHIKYFVDCYNRLTKKVTRLPQYIRTSLYKNCDTIEHYYTNLVNHNMNQMAVQSMESNPTPVAPATTNRPTVNNSNSKNKFHNFPQRERTDEYHAALEKHLLNREFEGTPRTAPVANPTPVTTPATTTNKNTTNTNNTNSNVGNKPHTVTQAEKTLEKHLVEKNLELTATPLQPTEKHKELNQLLGRFAF